jgi:hypothetical protein
LKHLLSRLALLAIAVLIGAALWYGKSLFSKEEAKKTEEVKHFDAASAEAFWKWFGKEKTRIAKEIDSGDPERVNAALDEVIQELSGVASGLSFLYGDMKDDKECVITALGDREYFEDVKKLVDSAPKLKGWRVVAFRPAAKSTNGFRIKMGDIDLGVEDVQFQAFDLEGGKLGITLYPKGLTDENRNIVGNATIVLLDHTVGEYNAVMKIDSLIMEPIAKAEKGKKLYTLDKLPGMLKKR